MGQNPLLVTRPVLKQDTEYVTNQETNLTTTEMQVDEINCSIDHKVVLTIDR